MKKILKLSNWAKFHNMSYSGAYNAFLKGNVDGAFRMKKTNSIMVEMDDGSDYKTVIYSRVSSHKQKDDLKRQQTRMTDFCMANGWKINKIYKEVASGMNDNRRELNKILDRTDNIRVVVEHKDRLTRFGYEFIEKIIRNNGGEIYIVNETINKDDLMQDFISIVTSFCARIYGRRRTTRKAEKIIEVLRNEDL